jgi:opacity protein-like surface antigen
MKILNCVALLVMSSTSFFSQANDDFYIEPMYSYQTIKYQGYSLATHNLGANLGYYLNKNIAAEFRIGTGIKDDSFNSMENIGTKLYFGAYIKGNYPVSNMINIYGLAGFAVNVQESYTNSGNINVSNSLRGLALGGGINIKQNESLSYTLGIHYLNGNSSILNNITSYQIGFNYRF